ncbi:universal stress protein [Haloplanus sp. GCM10025708]|uniref:universal stress protein n=1 Tax=Haloferacaceae TaxID=1644056 RepID=UPI003622E9B9
MYDRILFPTDGSDVADPVFDYALDVADAHDAEIHVLHVADTTQDSVTVVGGDVVDVLVTEGERIVAETAERATERGLPVTTEVLQGHPSDGIVDYARNYDIDLVVMPTHGREGLKRVLLGSVTERVVNDAPVPVLTVNPDAEASPYPAANVLVPTDGSRGANLALDEGIGVVDATDATLHILHVVETGGLGIDVRSAVAEDRLAERADEVVADAADAAASASVDAVTEIAHGGAYRKILEYVEENDIDLVVVGTHGRTGFDRYLLGSVTSKLVRTSPVPVLLVRASTDDSSA